MLKLSQRANVSPFIAMDVLSKAQQLEAEGHKVIHMEVGQPSFKLPQQIKEKIAKTIQTDYLGYTPANGQQQLKEQLSLYYKDYYNVEIEPERFIITTGSSAGFNLSFLACFEPGDKILMPVPGYPAYRNILKALGLEIIEYHYSSENDWRFDIERVKALHAKFKFNGILLASPNNPTGSMLSPDELKLTCDFCSNHGIRFLSDEIYHQISYGKEEATAAAFSKDAIVVNSFSKFFGLTGWRIGWLIVAEELVRPIEKLAQSLYISAPTISQNAALSCLQNQGLFKDSLKKYQGNRDILLSFFDAKKMNYLPADGAFYIYLDIEFTNLVATILCEKLLNDHKIAVTPGNDFDPEGGHKYIRISYARDEADIITARDKMDLFFSQYI